MAFWGLAFKPGTDDMREAPSLVMIDELLKAGCRIKGHDPISMTECKRRIGDSITYCHDIYEAADGADAVFLVTEWNEFRVPEWERVKKHLVTPVIFDGRNLYDREELRKAGFVYYGVGLK